ncbi:MAG: Rid family detoxifying hydrolase [Acidiferrobacteraceae bacterium]|jgi:reactive intermediate/imine deaminase
MKEVIQVADAPKAIGTYSQAVRAGDVVYLSGQIPLDPATMELVPGDVSAQVERVIDNLAAVARGAGAGLSDIVRLTVYLVDLAHFPVVNEVMARRFVPPYPARAVVGVKTLPRAAAVEIDGILVLRGR